MDDETTVMTPDQTLSLDVSKQAVVQEARDFGKSVFDPTVKTSRKIDPPEAPDLGTPQRYRRKGSVTAIQYTGSNRQALIDHAGAYIVNEDDALVVTVDGDNHRLFPGDVALLRVGSKDPDERCEGVIGAAVWTAEYELV